MAFGRFLFGNLPPSSLLRFHGAGFRAALCGEVHQLVELFLCKQKTKANGEPKLGRDLVKNNEQNRPGRVRVLSLVLILARELCVVNRLVLSQQAQPSCLGLRAAGFRATLVGTFVSSFHAGIGRVT